MKIQQNAPCLVGLLAVLSGLVPSSACRAKTISVGPAGAGDFTEIQPAIDAAQDGDTVLVAPGEYVISERINFNRLQDPEAPEGPSAKNISLISTEGPDETFLQMAPDSFALAGIMILFDNGESRDSVVEGFTLRGSGIACWNASSPVLRNCVVEDSIWWGGGVFRLGAVDCREGSSPSVESCKLSRNKAVAFEGDSFGGGVYCEDSSPSFADCEFVENSGIYIGGDSEAAVMRSSFVRNWSIEAHGNSSLALTDSTFLGNSVVLQEASATLTNCVIAGSDGWYGDGVMCDGGSVQLRNCTIIDNKESGVAVFGEGSVARLASCILWDNEAGALAVDDGATVDVSYSCIDQELPTGIGNIRASPRFCRGETISVESSEELQAALWRGYSLSRQSPCIASGEGGADMGADLGVCESSAEGPTTIRLAAGSFTIRKRDIIPTSTFLVGAGEDLTMIEGDLLTLRAGSSLSHVTLEAGLRMTSAGPIEISQCTIRGAIGCSGASPLLERCTIETGGIGVSCGDGSAPILRDCLLRWNVRALSSSGSNPQLIRCVISGNMNGVTLYDGGLLESCLISGNKFVGIYCGGSSVFKNCLLTGNGGVGGEYAAAVDVTGSPVFVNCTLSGNTVGFNFRGFRGSPTVINCVAWGNSGESIRLVRSEPTIAYSCIEGAEIWPGENNTNLDPLFVRPGQFDFSRVVILDDAEDPFPDYIVDAGDYRLQPGSPSVDRGTADDAPAVDIEGRVRPCGDGVDIGAYEIGDCPTPAPFLRGDCNADGMTDIADPVYVLNHLFSGGPAPSCLQTADANDDNVVDIADPVYQLNHLFGGGPALNAPVDVCGPDPRPAANAEDDLSCVAYPPCEA